MSQASCFFIATSWGPRAIPQQFRALGAELARRGHEVVLILDENRLGQTMHADRLHAYSWPSGRPTHARDAWFLWHLIREYRPSCLVGNFGAVNLMLLVGWLMRVPARVAWYHTLASQVDMDSALSSWTVGVLRWRKRLVYRLATSVVPVSSAAARDVHQVFGVPLEKCHVLHNSLPDPMDPRPPRDESLVVCTGRLYPSKGQETVIRALAAVRHQLPELRVEFLGQGPWLEALIDIARTLGVLDRCAFAGKLTHQEILKRMAAARAVIVPSRSEAFGLVTIEALAMGTPVIATGTGGTLDIITDGVEGLLVPPNDPDTLAARLVSLFSDRERADRMGQHARRRFLDAFEQRQAIRRQADWLERLTHARPSEVPVAAVVS